MVVLFLAQGFEEIEALVTVDVLRRAGCEVRTVGIEGKSITGSHGITVTADWTEEELRPDSVELVVLPGGMPGTKNLDKSKTVHDLVLGCKQRDAYVAAICAAPSVLGHLGMLQGEKATCYPGFEQELEGAVIVDEPVCVSNKIITGRGAGAAMAFALLLVEQLLGREKAQEVASAMQYEK